MKRKGEIDFFLKKQKQADQVQTDPSPCITTGPQSSSLPEASQSQCGQTSQGPSLPTPDVSRDDTETSGSEQDSEPELPGDVIEPLPTASSTRYAVPKGPNDISRSREEGPVQPCLTFPRTQHGTRKRAFNGSWYKDNSWLKYSMYQGMTQRPLALSKTVSQSCQEMSSSPSQLHQAPDMLFQKDPMTFQDPEKRVLYSRV
ncbi:uncharacterized protein ACWYII_036694 isoform 1-T1 [Salvelinus alpinus]|uniref:uncharacterized protein n=1 Tax=Salvelinus alpinus TaxID=8036 RepID=UPI0039FD4F38